MSKTDEIIILGAGLSGMVASIILAREGRKVKVIEGAKEIGGDMALHPSIHATPVDIDKVASWTGLDTDRMFVMGKRCQTFIRGQSYEQSAVFLVERGNRPSSIDSYLFEEAKKLGVEFEFGRYVKDRNELPKGSIMATGFHPAMFKVFGTPNRKGGGFFKAVENDDPSLEGSMYVWMGPYTKDYAYGGVLNGLKYVAVFSRFGLADNSLSEYQKHLKATLGWEFDDWKLKKNIPIPYSFKKPKLWVDDYILTGTVGGVMDPMGGFGIHGAILSGVIAAWAILDPQRAEKEFKRLNNNYTTAYLAFETTKYMPFRDTFYKTVIAFPEIFRPFTSLMTKGIPGIDTNWAVEMTREFNKGRPKEERFKDMAKIFKA